MSQFNNALEAVVNNALTYENIRIYRESTDYYPELVEWKWDSGSGGSGSPLRALRYYDVVTTFTSKSSPSVLYIIIQHSQS